MCAGLLVGALPGVAAATNVDPVQWPSTAGLDASLETTAHSIRFAGPDRYQTNLTVNLALRGKGDFPFDTPDPTSGGASGLAQAGDWWGAATCPRSILVVAGDTFADALAASSLSDPGDHSAQPRVQRVAAADPLFDPIGGLDRVDTAYAPIVVTNSAREGATALAQTARVTAADLAKGGCKTAREAIIVGGTRSVPVGAESELVSLGYDEVFRVGGVDRYDTAARVATALGTEAPAPGATCIDPDVTDGSARMGFYGNSVVEFRPSPTECQLLSRSVVLADGGTGADALAAGWWTSQWQVPVLLTAPDGSLPAATRVALQTLDVDSIIVLGGTGRIPESSVNQASRLAGNAVFGRINGSDRYETSLRMAEVFGGWYRRGDGGGFDNDMVCLAASSGSGATATGWADALGAGPWCGRVGGAAAAVGGPDRVLPPADGPAGTSAGGQAPSHDAAPVLLVPSGGDLPASVATFLQLAFSPSRRWCSGAAATPCQSPGFAVAFGGVGGVSTAALRQAATIVSGGTYTDPADTRPAAAGAFVTDLDLTPVFNVIGTGDTNGCVPAGGLHDARWLVAARRTGQPQVEVDVMASGAYSSGVSAPLCVRSPRSAGTDTHAVSLSGHSSRILPAAPPVTDVLHLSTSVRQPAPTTTPAGILIYRGATDVDIIRSGTSARVTEPELRLQIDADGTFLGSITLSAGDDLLTGTIAGSWVTTGAGRELRGSADVLWHGARFRGGLRITLTGGPIGSGAIWTFDGAKVG